MKHDFFSILHHFYPKFNVDFISENRCHQALIVLRYFVFCETYHAHDVPFCNKEEK